MALTSRKRFLLGGALLGVGGLATGWFGTGLVEYMGAAPDTPWKALTADEAAVLDRLAEELIPADPPSVEFPEGIPGAHDANVVRFIDWQLAKDAPFAADLATYREHLAKIGDLPAAEVEKTFPKFFNLVLKHVKLGFYGHPCHGGNADWASSRMIGLAGPAVTGRNIPGKENHL